MKNKYINPTVEITEIKFESIMDVSNPVDGGELFGLENLENQVNDFRLR